MSTPDPAARPDAQVDDIGTQVHEIGNRTYLVADVEPLDVSGVRFVAVGAVLFLLAGLGLLPFHGWLEEHDREWWLWTCAAGFGLGMFGVDYCRRRARHLHGSD
ncbi:DUF2530 domain-containing protein [Nocardioides caldifontis]|uniref:DUF2530 domain-containing protein n=1 Tax=Nocardioides caldifontis TaxID=2588938 RepID=UPI001EF02AB7|nr:DUF2530 domain-containing protein [Nocardioides caldifontis]